MTAIKIEELIHKRSGSACELCSSTDGLELFAVPPKTDDNPDHVALLCTACRGQLTDPATMNIHHWHCLHDSMWSQVPAVQVLAYRILTLLHDETWARDLLEMLYLDDDILSWAKEGIEEEESSDDMQYIDCNGAPLTQGDSVTITKDLKVKGGGFTAKRGTMVRGISLDPDNDKQIEGRVGGQHIVIYTKFVKKA